MRNVFSGDYKTTRNELIECISMYIDEHVENEIKNSNFFSVQIDEATYIFHTSQCATLM